MSSTSSSSGSKKFISNGFFSLDVNDNCDESDLKDIIRVLKTGKVSTFRIDGSHKVLTVDKFKELIDAWISGPTKERGCLCLSELDLPSDFLAVQISNVLCRVKADGCFSLALHWKKPKFSASDYTVMMHKCKKLTDFDLDESSFDPDAFSVLMQKLPMVESLSLENCNIGDTGMESMQIADHMNNFLENLTSLDLGGNKISGNGLKYLCDAFYPNVNMDILRLDDNDIDNDGIKALSRVILRGVLNLEHLGLESNRFTDQGMMYLAAGINQSDNDELRYFSVSGNSLTRVSFEPLRCLLIKNCLSSAHGADFIEDTDIPSPHADYLNYLSRNWHELDMDREDARFQKCLKDEKPFYESEMELDTFTHPSKKRARAVYTENVKESETNEEAEEDE